MPMRCGRSVGCSSVAVCVIANERVAAVRVDLEDGAQRVDAGRLEPQLAPLGQLAAGGLLELAEQVGEGRVAPRVLAEVLAQRGDERLAADVGDELLEHRGALGVGDAVEVDLDVLEVADVGDDRVRRRTAGPGCRPRPSPTCRRSSRPRPLGGLGLAGRRRPLGERLVEPEVVPPLHGHEVAEPHVGELVQDGQGPALDLRLGDLGRGRRRPR